MKEVIRTIIIVILIAAAIYYAFVVNNVKERMAVLNEQDSLQTIQVEEFDHKVHDLELRFEGRGKHIRQFQARQDEFDMHLNILNRKIDNKADSLGLIIRQLRVNTENELTKLKNQQAETERKLSELRRKEQSDISDLRQIMRRMNQEVNDLDDRLESIEKKMKEKEKK